MLALPTPSTTTQTDWRNPGRAVALTHAPLAKRPRLSQWQRPEVALRLRCKSWQDTSSMPSVCSDVSLDRQIANTHPHNGVNKRAIINLDVSTLKLAKLGAVDIKSPETEYARNGASAHRIRELMQGSCGCARHCYRHFSFGEVAQICNLFWSLGAMEQEHLVHPLDAAPFALQLSELSVNKHI